MSGWGGCRRGSRQAAFWTNVWLGLVGLVCGLFPFQLSGDIVDLAQPTGDLLGGCSPGEGLPGSVSAPKTWLTPDKPWVPRLFTYNNEKEIHTPCKIPPVLTPNGDEGQPWALGSWAPRLHPPHRSLHLEHGQRSISFLTVSCRNKCQEEQMNFSTMISLRQLKNVAPFCLLVLTVTDNKCPVSTLFMLYACSVMFSEWTVWWGSLWQWEALSRTSAPLFLWLNYEPCSVSQRWRHWCKSVLHVDKPMTVNRSDFIQFRLGEGIYRKLKIIGRKWTLFTPGKGV